MVSCVLCQRSEQTKLTGPLSTKDEISAHQNCLLFSSGLYCRDSPQWNDLFGFSVEDVMDEVKRGSKLICKKCKKKGICKKCKKKGATVGCEVGRCKKSYHYPCALEGGAKTVEEVDTGKYKLYCTKHYEGNQTKEKTKKEKDAPVNGCAKPIPKSWTSIQTSAAGSPKEVHCPACRKTEGNISLESLSDSIIMLYCESHAPMSHKGDNNGVSPAARPSACSSDSSNIVNRVLSKRPRSSRDKQEETPSKLQTNGWQKKISTSSTEETEPSNSKMAIFAPLESDLDDSVISLSESQLFPASSGLCPSVRKDSPNPAGSTPGNQVEDESRDQPEDEDETMIHSDTESESLLLPVEVCVESQFSTVSSLSYRSPSSLPSMPLVNVEVCNGQDEDIIPVPSSPDPHSTGGPSEWAPRGSSTDAPPHSSPDRVITPSAAPQAPPLPTCVTVTSSPSTGVHPGTGPRIDIDSAGFWESCNAAGCTRAIFAEFIDDMSQVSGRIQSGQASRQDYDLALTVLATSGKLVELVAKQQKELQRKQTELEKAAAAMKEVVSALNK